MIVCIDNSQALSVNLNSFWFIWLRRTLRIKVGLRIQLYTILIMSMSWLTADMMHGCDSWGVNDKRASIYIVLLGYISIVKIPECSNSKPT